MEVNRYHVWFTAVFVAVFSCLIAFGPSKPSAEVQAVYGSGESVYQIYSDGDYNRPLSIRVLICRHAPEQMAIDDGRLVENAVNAARRKGLDIKVVGNDLVRSLTDLERSVQTNIDKAARPGDTFIVHTIGHGHGSGYLQALGQRSGVFDVIVKAAESRRQETIWWQLSCHAAAQLPNINSLSDRQQRLMSNIASSDANTLSPTGVEGRLMQKVFVALAEKDERIDPNRDGLVTAGELRSFLNTFGGRNNRGHLLFARNEREPIFGVISNNLPIRDRLNPSREFPNDFVPFPSNPPTYWMGR
jgi:hypothetical protein